MNGMFGTDGDITLSGFHLQPRYLIGALPQPVICDPFGVNNKNFRQKLNMLGKEKLDKTDAEVNRLEMQCESLDRQIDAAVYELYGLTPACPPLAGKPAGREEEIANR